MDSQETHRRSVLKALSWRVIATATTMLAAYIITGSATAALSIGAIEASAKLVLYYTHERAWLRVAWGKI